MGRTLTKDMPTILIGEDDEFLLQLMKMALTMEGFRVKVARDGPSALALAKGRPDAALLDVCLPGAKGTDVLRELRRDEETRDLPVVLMSGCDPAGGEAEGAQAFMRKPFTIATVVATMKGLVQPVASR
jgi:two-component system, OmpR family, phosphate regulon response regulator PhoB